MPIPINVSETDATSTAQDTVAEQNLPTPPEQPENPRKKLVTEFRQKIDSCKSYRRKLVKNWQVSVDYRRGKPFASQSDEDRIAVPLDWSLTKSKQAALFSQVPQVRVVPHASAQPQGPWVQAFENKLNDTLLASGIEAAMDEALPDCINAAGIGVVLVAHEAITADVDIPIEDPSMLEPGVEPKTITIPKVLDHRYLVQRISPSDLLWPIEFTGSDFDNASWIGRSGRATWAEAVRLFDLAEADKEKYLGEDRTVLDHISTDELERERAGQEDKVGYDEIFYRENQYETDSKSYSTIRHIVFLAGKPDPIIDKPWEGQKEVDGNLLGAIRYPIRVLTLSYITDETIPPSDSAIGRPQVNEINKARTQMIQQRERSMPLRWFDVNRIDPAIQAQLLRGVVQNMIPVQGQGDRVIGEVARANFPQENFEFDQVAKSDLTEAWSVGPNQLGSGRGIETAAESDSIESNFHTRTVRERAKVGAFFVGIAEVTGGLICVFEQPDFFGQGFDPSISKALRYSILPDSSVLLDANQKLQRLMQFINFAAKSGFVNIEPVLREVATLSGLDPNLVIQKPQPKSPVEPSISLRLTGAEDMLNPLTLAFLLKSGQGPDQKFIDQAKSLIQQALLPPVNPLPEPVDLAPPAPPAVGAAHPDWEAMSRINKRSADGSEGGI